MASDVEICNLALSNIRARSINSLDEGSLQSQVCSLKYSLLRDMLLTEVPWGFARSIKALALTTKTVFSWSYVYSYPSDCLQINRLVGAQEDLSTADASVISRLADSGLLVTNDLRAKIPYEIFNVDGTKTICANDSDLRIDYTKQITDPNQYTHLFILALSHLLAAEIAIPIVGAETGMKFREDSLTMYKSYIAEAIINDLNEEYSQPAISEFETIRR